MASSKGKENSKDHDQDHHQDGSEAEEREAHPTTGKGKNKRKKAKAKVVETVNKVIARGATQEIPQELVDHVVDAVNAQGGIIQDEEEGETNVSGPSGSSTKASASTSVTKATGKPVSEDEVRRALEILKVVDMIQGKSGLGGKNKKEMGEYRFWRTQPVPQMGDALPTEDGPIEPSVPREQVRQAPYELPTNFVWSQIDMDDPDQKREVYELLSQNYVEDTDATFRFQYSAEFLEWHVTRAPFYYAVFLISALWSRALKPPGFHKEWHIGIRGVPKNKLVAFISGVPIKLKVRDHTLDVSEINYLCIHKKLRSKRLTPVLIKEVTRQCHLLGVFQAIYTGGVLLPTPISTCRYYHRTLNIPKLVDVNFTYVPRNSTLAKMKRDNAVRDTPSLAAHGLREMEERDLEGVENLFNAYMKRFKMIPVFTRDEIRHNLYSGRGEGEVGGGGIPGRRAKQVVWSYVVEDPTTHQITDFFSFYSLPSSVMKNPKHTLLEAAYMFYYATDVVLTHPDDNDALKKRLTVLIGDLLIVANQAKFDVVNAMTLMDNPLVLKELKFGPGDGFLNFYLYNWRTLPLEGNQALSTPQGGGQGEGRGIGVVML